MKRKKQTKAKLPQKEKVVGKGVAESELNQKRLKKLKRKKK